MSNELAEFAHPPIRGSRGGRIAAAAVEGARTHRAAGAVTSTLGDLLAPEIAAAPRWLKVVKLATYSRHQSATAAALWQNPSLRRSEGFPEQAGGSLERWLAATSQGTLTVLRHSAHRLCQPSSPRPQWWSRSRAICLACRLSKTHSCDGRCRCT